MTNRGKAGVTSAIVLTIGLAGLAGTQPALAQQEAAGQEKPKNAGPPPAVVGVDEVRSIQVDQTVPVLGRFVTNRMGTVAARVSGAIDEVFVNVGDRVEAGDRLVRQDGRRFQLAIKRHQALIAIERAAVKTAEADVAIKQQLFDRQERLKDSVAYSGARLEDTAAELERTRNELAQKKAIVIRAEADLEIARVDLADTEIKAPYSGTVIVRQAQPGAYLSASSPVVTLLDDTALEIEADVPSVRVSALKPGRMLSAKVGEDTLQIEVRTVIPDENAATRTRAVRFSLAGSPPEGLAQNQTVTVEVPISTPRSALTVHKDAVIQSPAGAIVYVVREGKAAHQPVSLGPAVGSRLEVLNGLAAGDIVVVRGNERLRPGQPVSF
ncbi:MAG TPA: efflux RND transporter periplasmic adaptor subunit [Afifellaceae bacterium]|nr:efflux RND transporter periplasmic adaptor subunit [Afifellaceae bacterium]